MPTYRSFCGRMLSLFGIAALLLTSATLFSGIACAQNAEEKARAPLPPLPELPLSPTERAEKEGTALRLSIRDVTKMALQNNLDIAIEDTNESTNRQSIIQSFGPYDPKLTISLGLQSDKSPNTNFTQKSTSGNFSKQSYAVWNIEYKQDFRTGGSFTFSTDTYRRDYPISFNLFNPQYSSSTTVRYVQPLLRNFRIDANRGKIRLAKLDLKVSDSQFKAKVVDTIASAQQQYWDLVEAIRNYEIQRESVRLAQTALRDHRRKVEIGTMAPINVVEDEVALKRAEESMISAEQAIVSAENTLLTMISSDRKGEIWSQIVVPTDKPDFVEQLVDLSAALDAALRNSPELEQSRLMLEQNSINQKMSNDTRKWQLDLTGQIGAKGSAGPQSIVTDPITGETGPGIDPELVGGAGKAYKLAFGTKFTNWMVGFDIQIPLRNRNADAQVARYKIAAGKEQLNQKKIEQRIQADIRTAFKKVETDRRRVESAKSRCAFAKEQYIGEQKRFEAGASENYQVLQRQLDYSSAQYAELQALISYKKSLVEFQKKQYTLLETNDFVTASGGTEKAQTGK